MDEHFEMYYTQKITWSRQTLQLLCLTVYNWQLKTDIYLPRQLQLSKLRLLKPYLHYPKQYARHYT